MDVEVVGEEDRKLPPGEVGRLRCRGPSLAAPPPEFVGSDTASEGFHDGWYYTGELAAIDERGYVFLKGRASDVIIRSGAKIHPAEIEAVLQEHDAVMEAAVIGRSAPSEEEAVVAFVVVRRVVALGELVAHCRARLTPYKVPREIRIVAQLPRNSAGKIDKRALAALPPP
jgi:acyl-coenzyme A synthetase/AMP-(fatty) acid ligase